MAYSNIMTKGRIGYTDSLKWPLIVLERAKSDKPETPVLCEVWGFAHESGSVYYKDITLTDDLLTWVSDLTDAGYDVKSRYYKGELETATNAGGVK